MSSLPSSSVITALSPLGVVEPASLVSARVTLHWASQAAAAFGFSALPAVDDFSHTALRWSASGDGLDSQVHESSGIVARLDLAGFALVLVRGEDEVARCSLDGLRLEEAYAWLGRALQSSGVPIEEGIVRPGHLEDMPPHPVQSGEPFTAPSVASREEVARWFAAADALLASFAAAHPEASAVYCWPHHFDTATLVVLEGEGESMRSVGMGLSPGDGTYDEPYFYVTPWPYPSADGLPKLPGGGAWHTEGWTGAILKGSDLLAAGDGQARAELAERFIHEAFDAAARLAREAEKK